MKSNIITLIEDGVMTGVTVVSSQAVDLNQIWGYAIQAVWTGTPVGIIKLQASCDEPNTNGLPPTNWTDIIDSPQAVSGSGDFVWNVTTAAYRWVRIVYTNSSGVGVLNAKLCVKGV